MVGNTISFKIRSYKDYRTIATHLSSPNRYPSHLGVMYHTRFNPAVALMNGANENLMVFAALFRKWAWFGTKYACIPVARGLVDPAHLAKEFGSGSGTIGMDPFDVQLFHAWKRDNGAPQTVPLSEPDPQREPGSPDDSDLIDNDPYFMTDPSWRKTPVTRPWATFIRPTGTGVRSSHSMAGSLAIGDPASILFDADRLRAHMKYDAPDEPVTTRGGVNYGGQWDESHTDCESGIGVMVTTANTPSAPTADSSGTGTHAHNFAVTPSQQDYIANYHVHLLHPQGLTVVDPDTREVQESGWDYIWKHHQHDIGKKEMDVMLQDYTRFTYEGNDRESQAHPWSPDIQFFANGRLHPVNPWHDTKTWMMRDDPDTGETYAAPCWFPWAPDAYGLYWRCPRHFNTVYQFRVWEIHSYALKSPIVNNMADPYGDPISCRRDMKFDSMVIDTEHPETILSPFCTFDDLEKVKGEILRITYLKSNKVQEVHTREGIYDGREYGEFSAGLDSAVSADRGDGDSGNNPSGVITTGKDVYPRK